VVLAAVRSHAQLADRALVSIERGGGVGSLVGIDSDDEHLNLLDDRRGWGSPRRAFLMGAGAVLLRAAMVEHRRATCSIGSKSMNGRQGTRATPVGVLDARVTQRVCGDPLSRHSRIFGVDGTRRLGDCLAMDDELRKRAREHG
jgi:hypothetical protein